MKKQVKGIIGLSAVLVVLGGGLVFLKLTDPDKDKPSEGSEELVDPNTPQGADIIIVSDDKSDGEAGVVKRAVIKNETDEIKVKMVSEATEEESAVYTIEGFEDLNVNSTLLSTLINNGNGLHSTSLVEEHCTNFEKFGLDDPRVTVEYEYESGGHAKFYMGDDAPSNTGAYVYAEGSDTVYTASFSALANFKNTAFDFLDKTILDTPSDPAGSPRIDKFMVERDDLDKPIVLEYDKSSEDKYSGGSTSTHIMTSPTECHVSGDKASEIMTKMYGLYAKSIYAVHCKESDIAGAGLKEPYCRVTLDCEGTENDHILLLSEIFTDEFGQKCCYAMFEGGNTIYTITEENAIWLKSQPIEIISKLMVNAYVWNLSNFTFDLPDGTSEKFDIKLMDGKERDGARTEDYEVKRNGKEFDSERYRQLYAFLISGNLEEFALDVPIPSEKPLMSFSYTDAYNKKTYTYDFYDDSVMKALVVINGESSFYCSKSFINTLIDNVKRVETGEDYVTTW